MARSEPGLSLRDARVLLILESGDAASILAKARAALAAGVWALEIDTSEGTEALSAIVHERLPCVPGAGGVRDAGAAWAAVEAGARFVAGTLDGEIAAVCEAAGVDTISEAEALGEVRDALLLRPDFIRPRPDMQLSPSELGGAALIREVSGAGDVDERWSSGGGTVLLALREGTIAPSSLADLARKLEVLGRTVEGDVG